MKKKWTIVLEEDTETGELVLPFTPEILEELGWKEGDSIRWKNNKDGSWTLTKIENIDT
jgi:hypothetical protein